MTDRRSRGLRLRAGEWRAVVKEENIKVFSFLSVFLSSQEEGRGSGPRARKGGWKNRNVGVALWRRAAGGGARH